MAGEQQQEQQQGEFARPLVCEMFAGVNTATTRPGVPENQCYWIDGFIPLAPGNLRTLYGIGSPLFTSAPYASSVVCFYFYNIGANPYAVVFLSNGEVVQVNTSTGVATGILGTGTIINPSITSLGITQYGQQYLIIVSNQTNGYWLWDGAIVYTGGTLAPGVVLTNVGSGYVTPPNVQASGGNGIGATFVATISGGQVTGVKITNSGTGYLPTDDPVLIFTGGNQSGSGASLTAVLSLEPGGTGATTSITWAFVGVVHGYTAYAPTGVTVPSGGAGYTPATVGSFAAVQPGTLWYGNAAPGVNLSVSSGVVQGVSFFAGAGNPNEWYLSNATTPVFPTVTITDPGAYEVTSVTIVSGGSGYGPDCAITVGGGGSPITQAVITPVVSGGVIGSVNIASGGAYGSNTPPSLVVTDSATTAAGTISLMAYGISGTAVQTYQGHVWVFNGSVFNFSAPGSPSNFATSAGGGSQQSSASYLRVAYIQAVSTNGFLFLIGDSSMDYISGVSTTTPSGGSPTTSFTQNNSDPEVGTPYPAAVTTLGQEILVANSTGVLLSSGGEFVKRSEAMDGVYNTVANFNGQQLSAAKATIFGKRTWMVLVPIIDPVSNLQVNKLLMFRDDGKVWWASQQDVPLEFIAGQEINSIYTAWGTDGTIIYQLFAQPSTAVTKLVQTKYWATPKGYDHNKAISRFWSVWQFYNVALPAFTVNIDAVINTTGGTFANSQPYDFAGPGLPAYLITLPQSVGQQGILNGFTISTNVADAALVSAMIQPGDVAYLG